MVACESTKDIPALIAKPKDGPGSDREALLCDHGGVLLDLMLPSVGDRPS